MILLTKMSVYVYLFHVLIDYQLCMKSLANTITQVLCSELYNYSNTLYSVIHVKLRQHFSAIILTILYLDTTPLENGEKSKSPPQRKMQHSVRESNAGLGSPCLMVQWDGMDRWDGYPSHGTVVQSHGIPLSHGTVGWDGQVGWLSQPWDGGTIPWDTTSPTCRDVPIMLA